MVLIGLLRKAKKKGEEFASCGQTLLTVWDRTGIKDAKIEKPAEVAAFLAALTKYATVEHLPVLSRLIYKLLEDKSMVNTLSSVLVDILKNSAVDASSQVVIYAVSNIAQCARWIRAPFVECLAEVHELLEDKQQQKRLRFLASTLYFAFDPLDWRLRNLLTHEFTKIVATIDDPKIIEAEFTDMGQVLVKERAFDNRLDLCYLLAVTMSRLVEFQDMDRAKRFASLLETQMLHSEDHRCRFAFATVCGFLLREFMISDADFDKILGDNFFIFLPHDRVNTVRGKFRGLDRPNASALFGVAHRLHPIKRTLKIIARVDSSQVNREIADQILSEAASKAKEEFCTRLEVDVENHDPLCIERLYEDSDASAESDDAGIDFDDLKEEQASPEILSTKNMCKRIMTELPTF
ncbi:hypothetical protein L596_009533 [Steinernema carpocapsae]|uniref:Uncharacterized protein n=1 Tax=Steinernema carpocapsae TaxID=34508 RepID=A0A4U5PFN0_STECR|nr:hypothetical protein L596_009533 [Steinernema carpocapsae]